MSTFLTNVSFLNFVNVIPKGVRRTLVRRLAGHQMGYQIFRALARCYGVKDIRIAGEYGRIEGPIEDRAIVQTYARTKSWARETNRFFCDFFSRCEGGTYIDIGANIGLTTIPVARNPRVACKAFEPEPANFRYLVQNMNDNGVDDNVELFNMALFDRKAALEFDLSDYNFGDHRIRIGDLHDPHATRGRAVIKVQADRLDDVLGGEVLAEPIAVKIDTQGAEGQIFAGGERILARAQVVVFEFAPGQIVQMGGEPESLAAFVERHFSSGAVVVGDRNEPPVWRPIRRVAKEMRLLAERAANRPFDYYEVFTRK